MNVLLDTHTLIWFYQDDSNLSVAARTCLRDPANEKYVSPASYWEIAIKLGTGKLTLADPYPDFLQHAILDNGFLILPIEFRHTAEVVALPLHHRDPFDRLLIAQAIVEGMPVLSADPAFDAYPVQRIW